MESSDIKNNLEELIEKKYTYPDVNDPDLQLKIYEKREFYNNRIPERPDVTNYEDIKEYRDNICARPFTLHEHQALLTNFINPNTPYKGLIIFHGLGSGKCVSKNTNVYINGEYMNIEDIWNKYKINQIVQEDDGEWTVPCSKLIVKSYDSKINNIIYEYVNHMYREKINSLIKHVELVNGDSVDITQIHKLYTKNGWTNELNIGDKIGVVVDHDNVDFVEIKSISMEQYDDYVYDLEIENTHNYVIENGIICHNTCVGVSLVEQFKEQFEKYNTKAIVLVSGPLIKENWKHHVFTCTGETYLKYHDKSVYMSEEENKRNEKEAMMKAMQYYKFMSYKSFYKHVIGEKITDRNAGSGKASYRKNDEGEFERDISIDRIYNLNNTIIVVDEAHNLTGNTYGDALKYIIKNSVNLRIILLSGTPMKNLGSDILELLNFIRPLDSQAERDKIFNNEFGPLMDFKEGGLDYLKKMMRGYVSHVRGGDPLTFAKRIDKGIIPKGLLFTKVTRCFMFPFQHDTYIRSLHENQEDTLDRKSEAIANFVFPGLSEKKELMGYYAGEGLKVISNQLKLHGDLINKKLSMMLLNNESEKDLIYLTSDGKNITGKILSKKYLKYFSVKFSKSLNKLEQLVWGKKGESIAFVYSNLVTVGINLYAEILIQNGYLEFQEDSSNYQINKNTVCYFCGQTYENHSKKMVLSDDESDNNDTTSAISTINSDDDSESYNEKIGMEIPVHIFRPATFITVTGKSSEEALEAIPEDKMNIIKNIFNSLENKDGRFIKFVLGSRVMNEGISLKNVHEVHILDAYFNFGRIDQVVGRAIRHCSHYKLMNENNVYPEVSVYKYVISLENELSSEEELYRKAELKYLLIKKIERVMKEVAIDCPLNMNGNMFKEEMDKYKDCGEGNEDCPAICDYTKCNYKCDDELLNTKYYDPNRNIYKKISKDKLDYSTFTYGLARHEIDNAKSQIKNMYITGYIYTIDEILQYVKKSYDNDKRELFDNFFVFKALDELIPISENDFNNFKDTILDKHNVQGYLIYVNKYYIFQPFDQTENVPMYYRMNMTKHIDQNMSLFNYIKNSMTEEQFDESVDIDKMTSISEESSNIYNFDDITEYYDNREEFEFVGLIDKENMKKKSGSNETINDVFKIREKRAKILEKKRATGIPSLKGAVCSTAKSMEYLNKVGKKINLKFGSNETRIEICEKIQNKMMMLEKYGSKKDKNKFTYMMIPTNHTIYKFPYNLEDRVDYIINSIKNKVSINPTINIVTKIKSSGDEKGYPSYYIHVKDNFKLAQDQEVIKNMDADKVGDEWVIKVE